MNNERDFLMSYTSESDSDIYHHGIIGQKWGVRRYQNKDGSLTTEGREHYGIGEGHKKSEKEIKAREVACIKIDNQIKDLETNGYKSKVFETACKRAYGANVLDNLKSSRERLKKLTKDKKKIDTYNSEIDDINSNGYLSKPVKQYCTINGFLQPEKLFDAEKKRLNYTKQISDIRLKKAKGEPLTEAEEKVYRDYNIKKAIAIGTIAIGCTIAGAMIYQEYQRKSLDIPTKSAAEVLKIGSLNDAELKDLADVDFVFKAGQEFYRQSPFKDVDLTNPGLFVSPNEKDRKIYRTFLGAGLTKAGTGEHWDITLKALKDIKAPSTKKAVEIFQDMLENDDDFFTILTGASPERRNEEMLQTIKDLSGDLRSYSGEELKERFARIEYSFINRYIGTRDVRPHIDKAYSKYRDRLLKEGYNAIMDLNDIGSFTNTPMILLDAGNTISQDSEKKVGTLLRDFGDLLIDPVTLLPFNRVKNRDQILFG